MALLDMKETSFVCQGKRGFFLLFGSTVSALQCSMQEFPASAAGSVPLRSPRHRRWRGFSVSAFPKRQIFEKYA
jgi:hypothetical protein